MPWFNVDDGFHSHPKPRKAGLAAVGLWTVAGSWSQATKYQGFVPEWFVLSWPSGKRLAADLVRVALWSPGEREDEVGWWFHDWLDIHQTADEIEEQRRLNRDRQRRRRAALRESHKKNGTAS